MQINFNPNYYATTPGIVIQWDGLTGTFYQCGECYASSLSTTAPGPGVSMSNPPRTPPSPGTRCYCGKQLA